MPDEPIPFGDDPLPPSPHPSDTESFETAEPIPVPSPSSTSRTAPHSDETESALLGACLLDAGETADAAISRGITSGSFHNPEHASIFAAITHLRSKNLPLDVSSLIHSLSRRLPSAPQILSRIAGTAPQTTAHTSAHIDLILDLQQRRDFIFASLRLSEAAFDLSQPLAETAHPILERLSQADQPALRDRYQSRIFNFACPPERATPRILLSGHSISSPGNLTNIIAQAKAGKTTFISAIIASSITAAQGISDRDTLSLTAEPPNGQILIHVDTEQSPFDHDQLVRLSLRRAGVESIPPWIHSYSLAGFTAQELRQTLHELLRRASRSNGIYAVILDGAADFVNDVNDPGECNPFVAELHSLAIEYNCPIINVVHENPGQDFGKMRGHLGSQLERKAESNLRLRKQDETTVVFSEKMRRAPILEKDGPRFRWDNQAKMHLSVASAGNVKDDLKRDKLRDMAAAVFEHLSKPSARYGEFLKAFQEVRKISPSYAEDKFSEMKHLGVVQKDIIGFWRLSDTPKQNG
jgi:hypothetical protein